MSASRPSTPRPSASLILINHEHKVLLVQRTASTTSFPGMHVFPGGNFDPNQDPSLRHTALRETFEETGLLLTANSLSSAVLSERQMEDARRAIHAQRVTFTAFMARYGLIPDLGRLMPFTNWITPAEVPRRFNAQFFVAFLPSGSRATFQSGGDGGREVLSAAFVSPRSALDAFVRGEVAMMPPQFYLLSTLAGVLPDRERVAALALGAFGRMTFNPARGVSTAAEARAGWTILTFEGDESRGGSPGRRHRALAKFRQGGIPTELILQRNFDILTQIEEDRGTKL